VLLTVAVLFAVGEALDSVDVGLIGVIFALLFATGALLMRKGRRSGTVLVGILVLVEVVAWPTFKRQTTVDWVVQLPFLIVGLVGLVALAMVLLSNWRTAKAAGPT
jgi:4-amino-4-deoxy-L-arabinose transferase-like glycosyltransferase